MTSSHGHECGRDLDHDHGHRGGHDLEPCHDGENDTTVYTVGQVCIIPLYLAVVLLLRVLRGRFWYHIHTWE